MFDIREATSTENRGIFEQLVLQGRDDAGAASNSSKAAVIVASPTVSRSNSWMAMPSQPGGKQVAALEISRGRANAARWN